MKFEELSPPRSSTERCSSSLPANLLDKPDIETTRPSMSQMYRDIDNLRSATKLVVEIWLPIYSLEVYLVLTLRLHSRSSMSTKFRDN